MKIFNRGSDTKAAPAPAAASPAPPPAAPAPAANPAPAAAPAPAPAPAEPPAPDLAVILDANVKEMSEKIARLASSVESTSQERGGFEAKLEQMEERMRKLSSLTEMISAQYNPFVGDAPTEREALPQPDVGLAPPPMAAPAALAPPEPVAPVATFAPPPEAAPQMLDLPPPQLAPAFDALEPAAILAPPEPEIAPLAAAPEAEPGVYLWRIAPGFENSTVLLRWADMLLKRTGSREQLLELVNYYHNIGWVGDPARDQILAYADGLAAPTEAQRQDWRADVELHERSLLYVEKLRGRRNG